MLREIRAVVPHDSILHPILHVLYISDLPDLEDVAVTTFAEYINIGSRIHLSVEFQSCNMKEITFWILLTTLSLNFHNGHSIGSLGSALSNIFHLSNPLNLLSSSTGNNGNGNSGSDDGADPEKVYPYVEFIHNHNYGIKLGRSFALGNFPNRPGNGGNKTNDDIIGSGTGQFFNGRRTVTTGNNQRDGDDDDNVDSINDGSFVNRGRQGSQSQLSASALQPNRNNNGNNGYNYRPNNGNNGYNYRPNNNVNNGYNYAPNNNGNNGYNYSPNEIPQQINNQPNGNIAGNGFSYPNNAGPQLQVGYNYNPPSSNIDIRQNNPPFNGAISNGQSSNGFNNDNINPNIQVTLEINNNGNIRNFGNTNNNSNRGQNFRPSNAVSNGNSGSTVNNANNNANQNGLNFNDVPQKFHNTRRSTRNDNSNTYTSNIENAPAIDQFTSNSLLLADKKRPFDVNESSQNQILSSGNNSKNRVGNNDIPLNVKFTKNIKKPITTTLKPTTRFYPIPVDTGFLKGSGDDIRSDPNLTNKNLATAHRDIVIRCPSGTNCVIYALSKSGVL
ncbi:probable serine/threonine-protein kinase clkA [Condylostylus longicornis]|uniref:probable serine/threonine-protein kinase clkA n=1 Tax=Condylostylus longicornis TaxID=2530218 RepID=UPI00244DB1BB|nr:probable serine/threonine-protein kinase clkA [Condylostylus longicornis]